MNVYQLLGLLNDLELPDGVISVSSRLSGKGFHVHMEPMAFMASFPQHESSEFNVQYNQCVFSGENVSVSCLVRIARDEEL